MPVRNTPSEIPAHRWKQSEPEFADPIEIEHVCTQQAAHAAGNIGQRGSMLTRYEQGD